MPTITDNLLTMGAFHGRTGQPLKPEGIVVHYVANPGSSALANRNYFESGSGGNGVSAHYIVGLNGEIVRCIPENECAMHAGKAYADKYKEMAATNNAKYIGIENCHPTENGKFNELTYASLVWLISDICIRLKFQTANIKRHYDVSGKNCPAYYVGNQSEWDKLLADVSASIMKGLAKTPVLAASSISIATSAQAAEWAKSKNASPAFISLAQKYYQYAPSRGNVNPAIAYCQAAKETAYGRFGGVLDESFCNPCGMKTAAGGGDYDKTAHQKFPNWDTGVQAHLDHLALYAGAAGYPLAATPDPRHFPQIKGTAKTFEELGGKWAGNLFYGREIVEMYDSMTKIKVPVTTLSTEEKLISLTSNSSINTPQYWINALSTFNYFDGFVKALYDKYEAKK